MQLPIKFACFPLLRARIAIVISVFLLLPVFSQAAKDFAMPAPQSAKTYPLHDEHANETVTVAVDPYDTAEKANIFSVHYSDMGLLPVFIIITNDGDQPIALSGMKAELVTADRTKLGPDSDDEIYRRLAHPSARTTNYPLPFPKKVKGSVNQKVLAEIQSAQFGAKAVEPHSTQAGFLFFDVSDIATPLAGAHFYLTGVHDAKGDELMYFEVSLDQSKSSAPPPKP